MGRHTNLRVAQRRTIGELSSAALDRALARRASDQHPLYDGNPFAWVRLVQMGCYLDGDAEAVELAERAMEVYGPQMEASVRWTDRVGPPTESRTTEFPASRQGGRGPGTACLLGW